MSVILALWGHMRSLERSRTDSRKNSGVQLELERGDERVDVGLGGVERAHPAHLVAARHPSRRSGSDSRSRSATPAGSVAKTPFACVGWLKPTPVIAPSASPPRAPRAGACAIAFACDARAQPQVALEQRDELRRDEPHLRRELHVELAQVDQARRTPRGSARRRPRRAACRSWCRRSSARRRRRRG